MRLEYKPENEIREEKEEYENVLTQGTTVSEQIKTQNEKMKDKPFREKFEYFWEYYKLPVIGTIVGVIILFSIIKAIVTAKDYCFVAMLVNSSNIDTEGISESFGGYAGLDLDKYDCYINANDPENLMNSNASDYGAATRFAALLASSDLDCVIYDSMIFNNKAVSDPFFDLTKILSDEDIKEYKDRFYYIDGEIMRKVNEDLAFNDAYNEERGTYDEQLKDLEYHMDPSSMNDPIPVGIVLTDSPMVKQTDSYYDLIPVFAITQNTQRLDTAITFLHYLTDDSVDFKSLRMY